MTQREKAIVMAYTGTVMLSGDGLYEFYAYIAEKLGRPVYTHELLSLFEEIKDASKDDFIALCEAVEDTEAGEKPNNQQYEALHLLYSLLKQARISLGRAEQRRNNHEERANLAKKIDTLEWIIGVVNMQVK